MPILAKNGDRMAAEDGVKWDESIEDVQVIKVNRCVSND